MLHARIVPLQGLGVCLISFEFSNQKQIGLFFDFICIMYSAYHNYHIVKVRTYRQRTDLWTTYGHSHSTTSVTMSISKALCNSCCNHDMDALYTCRMEMQVSCHAMP